MHIVRTAKKVIRNLKLEHIKVTNIDLDDSFDLASFSANGTQFTLSQYSNSRTDHYRLCKVNLGYDENAAIIMCDALSVTYLICGKLALSPS